MFTRISKVTVAIVIFAGQPAFGLSISAPSSYTKPTPNGGFLFVMIAPRSMEDEVSSRSDPEALEIRRLRNTFTQSGLYRNDGSSTPLWTVSWYAYDVEPLSDGVHLVRLSPWWASGSESEAVAFFANGKLLGSYTLGDLITLYSWTTRPMSHSMWNDHAQLDDQNKTYSITTMRGEQYEFDVTTGRILSSYSPTRRSLALVLVIFAAALGILWVKRSQRELPAR